MFSRILRIALWLLLACAIAAACTAGVAFAWRAIGGGEMSIHGWIALGLGVTGTLALTWTLMSLAFRSHRDGWDDQVDNRLDPGREEER